MKHYNDYLIYKLAKGSGRKGFKIANAILLFVFFPIAIAIAVAGIGATVILVSMFFPFSPLMFWGACLVVLLILKSK